MSDPLAKYRTRVEVAAFMGTMPEYVEDVSALLEQLDVANGTLKAFVAGHQAVGATMARLKMQADQTDTAESLKRDREMILNGAQQVVQAANIAIRVEAAS